MNCLEAPPFSAVVALLGRLVGSSCCQGPYSNCTSPFLTVLSHLRSVLSRWRSLPGLVRRLLDCDVAVEILRCDRPEQLLVLKNLQVSLEQVFDILYLLLDVAKVLQVGCRIGHAQGTPWTGCLDVEELLGVCLSPGMALAHKIAVDIFVGDVGCRLRPFFFHRCK